MKLSILDRLRLLGGFFTIARDPRNLDGVLDLADAIADKAQPAHLESGPVREALDRFREDAPLPTREALRALPEGSVGRELGRFLDDNGLDLAALDRPDDGSQLQRFRAAMRESHDLWHVVTGWTPDLLGELGLQAFYLAQMRIPFPAFVLAAGLLHVVWKEPRHFFTIVDGVADGYRQGREARPLAQVRWSGHLHRPLGEVRRELGVRPATALDEPVIPLLAA